MLLILAARRRQSFEFAATYNPYKIMQRLAAAVVPAHGFVVGTYGLTNNKWSVFRGKVWEFVKNLLRGCAWAAAIAAGMLVYTQFTAKWKEKGWPTIPIASLVAVDQATNKQIPISGMGGSYTGGYRTQTTSSSTSTRQTSLLDMDEYEG